MDLTCGTVMSHQSWTNDFMWMGWGGSGTKRKKAAGSNLGSVIFCFSKPHLTKSMMDWINHSVSHCPISFVPPVDCFSHYLLLAVDKCCGSPHTHSESWFLPASDSNINVPHMCTHHWTCSIMKLPDCLTPAHVCIWMANRSLICNKTFFWISEDCCKRCLSPISTESFKKLSRCCSPVSIGWWASRKADHLTSMTHSINKWQLPFLKTRTKNEQIS